MVDFIPVNPPPLCRSLQRKSLISRMDWVSHAGDINLPHDLAPTKNLSIIEIFRINFYRVSLDFSFRNTKLIVVYVIERTCTFSVSTIQI